MTPIPGPKIVGEARTKVIRDIDQELWVRTRLEAVRRGEPMKTLVNAALREWLERHEGKG